MVCLRDMLSRRVCFWFSAWAAFFLSWRLDLIPSVSGVVKHITYNTLR